jgi:hypothetical protein
VPEKQGRDSVVFFGPPQHLYFSGRCSSQVQGMQGSAAFLLHNLDAKNFRLPVTIHHACINPGR